MSNKLLKVCERYIDCFEGSDMSPEDVCHELYYQAKSAVEEAKAEEAKQKKARKKVSNLLSSVEDGLASLGDTLKNSIVPEKLSKKEKKALVDAMRDQPEKCLEFLGTIGAKRWLLEHLQK